MLNSDASQQRIIAKYIDLTKWNEKTQRRFDAKWVLAPDSDCRLWTARCNYKGYGQFWYGGRNINAHRVAYVVAYGNPSLELSIDHLCRTRNCVNPDHLESVTNWENQLRGDTVSSRNARKERCQNEHLLKGDNLIQLQLEKGIRACRICQREMDRQRHEAITKARRRLGLTCKDYRAMFGQGKAQAEAILRGEFDHLTSSGHPQMNLF